MAFIFPVYRLKSNLLNKIPSFETKQGNYISVSSLHVSWWKVIGCSGYSNLSKKLHYCYETKVPFSWKNMIIMNNGPITEHPIHLLMVDLVLMGASS